MYRQYDGYPHGHGAELAEFLNGGKVVNGIGADEKHTVFNGAGCLAAQMIAHFKNGAGGFYIEPITATRIADKNMSMKSLLILIHKEVTLKCIEVGYIDEQR